MVNLELDKHTEVVRTPQSVAGGCGVGAAGVLINSKSSEDPECVLAIIFAGEVAESMGGFNEAERAFSYLRKWRWSSGHVLDYLLGVPA